MAEKLKNIFEKLERAVRHRGDLRPIEGIAGGKSLPEKKGPLPDEFHVYGRDADREAIMEILQLNHENGPKAVAIPIVGLGGVGKTTLAQIVYSDRRVEDWFQLKAWVWVPEQFEVSRVIKDIMKEVKAKIIANKEEDELLKEALKGKKFFLVLDNVWNIEYNDWQKLLRPLQDVEQGSKIIVTTHNKRVAEAIQTVTPPYPLDGITEEECWLLFANHAFGGINTTAQSHLEGLGREIVSKCNGIPMAARTIGGCLQYITDVKEWEMIAKSSIWSLANENIPPVLKLSYYYLPSDKKRCFSYCAIIPKGSAFRKDQVIMLWMAEGFLGKEDMEDRGNEYFDDLVSRSFFQQSRNDPSSFFMHDLINDLAQYVSGDVCFKVGEFGFSKAPKRTRHFSYQLPDYNHVLEIFEDIHEVPPLRTFLSMSDESKYDTDLDERVLHDLLPMLNRLRVLSLPLPRWELFSLEKLLWINPLLDSIGNMKHLRYLDLSAMNMTRLPEKVCTLYYLQTLILRGCRCLIELPTNLSNLINLHHLIIEGTDLREMPSQMSKLTMLRKLTDFFLGKGKQRGSNLKELGNLVYLGGTLSIWNLQIIVNVQDALEADLKGKKHLEKLRLTWNGHTGYSQREKDILEKLEPHSNLKILDIQGYEGRQFPDWVGDSSFSNIATLTLSHCKDCTSLPPLGQLASLKQLSVMGLDGIVAIGSEFYGRCTPMKKPFASLQKLEFLFMLQWREWIPYADSNGEDGGAFPLLKELWIQYCPNLTNALPVFPSLSTLGIDICPWLVDSIPRNPTFTTLKLNGNSRYASLKESSPGLVNLKGNFLLKGMEQTTSFSTFLQVIEVEECDWLKCLNVELFPNVRSLKIKRCANLVSLSANEECLMELASLTSLKIIKCPNLVNFPELHAPELRNLQFLECMNLESFPKHMHSLFPSLVDLTLYACPKIELFVEGGFPCKLESLEIVECQKLIPSRIQWHLHSLPSLSKLKIGPIRDAESFPEKMILPSCLTSLTIWGLLNVTSLDSKELQRLTSLRKLELVTCSKLESMPEAGLPSSLSSLAIWGCPLLEERLKKGEDLDKISHITNVEINGCKTIFST